MVRYLVSVLVIAHVVYSEVPPTCASCNQTQAELIGKVTCNSQGNLVAECFKGPIQTKVDGKSYHFDRVTCINGDWFGTSCGGAAKLLSTELLVMSTCPDVDYPEQILEGSDCMIRPIGIPEIYDQYYTAFPKFSLGLVDSDTGIKMEDGFLCSDQQQWRRFRQTERVEENYIYARSDESPTGYTMIYEYLEGSKIACKLNPTTGKHEIARYTYNVTAPVFIGTNHIECLFRKCSKFHTFNKATGRCEADVPDNCGYALEGRGASTTYYPLKDVGPKNIPANCTHILVSPGYKVSVYGTKYFNDNPMEGDIKLVYEQTSGQYSIYSSNYYYDSAALGKDFNWPDYTGCHAEEKSKRAPRLGDSTISVPYQFSHESRYASLAADREYFIYDLDYLEVGFSVSLSGTGTGTLYFTMGGSGDEHVSATFNFEKKTYAYYVYGGDRGERAIVHSGDKFHVRFIYNGHGMDVHLNGRFIHSIFDPKPKYTNFGSEQYANHVTVERCDVFVPKECSEGHVFSAKTGDCEWIGKSDACAKVTRLDKRLPPYASAWVKEDVMPEGFELEASFIEVRQGCAAYAYNGENSWVQQLNYDHPLRHSRGRYNFPNFKSGTCVREKRGLKHLECYCEDYNKSPTYEGTVFTWPVQPTNGAVFSAKLVHTSPMAKFSLVNENGDAPLVVFFGDGKLLADNIKNGCLENHLVKADSFHIRINDTFECRIRCLGDGYEIRINGVFMMKYPYRQSEKMSNIARIEGGLSLEYHRTETFGSNVFDFGGKPLQFGEFVHYNGLPTNTVDSSFTISLLNRSNATLYTLQADFGRRELVQKLIIKSGTRTAVSKRFSLAIDVEFDIVLVNKPHSIEVYVNGEIIEVIGEHVAFPETKFYSARIDGNIEIFDQRRGPKKIVSAPKWKPTSG